MRTYESIRVSDIYKVIPTLDTSAYANGDFLTQFEIENVYTKGDGVTTVLELIDITDFASQNIGFDFFFFDSEPTVASSVNDALDITDSEMEKKIGSLSLAASGGLNIYTSTASNSSLTTACINLPLRRREKDDIDIGSEVVNSRSLFVVMKARGAATYLADSLSIRFGFRS